MPICHSVPCRSWPCDPLFPYARDLNIMAGKSSACWLSFSARVNQTDLSILCLITIR